MGAAPSARGAGGELRVRVVWERGEMGEYSDDEFDDDEVVAEPAPVPAPAPAAKATKASKPPKAPKATKATKKSSPPPTFEARPPPGLSPVQLGAMRSPRAPPKIDVKPVQDAPERASRASRTVPAP